MHMPDTRGASNIATLPILQFRDGPAPMGYPDPEALDRARAQRMTRLARDQRIAEERRLEHARELVAERQKAREDGFKLGHVAGTHWGLTVGALVGAAFAFVVFNVAPLIAARWPL